MSVRSMEDSSSEGTEKRKVRTVTRHTAYPYIWATMWILAISPPSSSIHSVDQHRVEQVGTVRLDDAYPEHAPVQREDREFPVQTDNDLGGVVVVGVLAPDGQGQVVGTEGALEAVEGVVAVVADGAVERHPEGVGLGDGVRDGDAVHPDDEVGDLGFVGLGAGGQEEQAGQGNGKDSAFKHV